ncbi:MAG TPA: pantoate--beta-alanine ligase [Ignavibacteria bacterium]|nr:pantoate--beta-alanine ligase [Bacteroidota bacterium]HRI84969.1 pantoate--beta-alanine ligase [Ignavibacteria bacterium]HRJ99646.1 pantoate--beta-alanine ligase [Ignavibacteria bacterium]
MKVVKESRAVQQISEYYKCSGKSVALVPTMGFLHEGHVSLMHKAKAENDILIVSIFVNPTQFGKGEDFDKYPRDIVRDFHICEKAGADYIFNPEVSEMYGENSFTKVSVSNVTQKLEGDFRPGHFDGVATVVTKLLNITAPRKFYLGQKDAQQNAVLKRMISDLNIDTELVVCETIREANGLAKSSRNTFLTEEQKQKASVLFFILNEGKRLILEEKISDTEFIYEYAEEILKEKAPEFELQYYKITDNEFLNEIKDLSGFSGEILISLACKAGNTRLIDNIIFSK